MKVVYSPNIIFSQHKALFRLMAKKFQLNHDQVINLERHDARLVEAAEELIGCSGGMSSLMVKQIPLGASYYIQGNYKEMLVLGLIHKHSILSGVQDEMIMHSPVTLETADLSKPCIYERSLGVLYVFSGSHEIVISRLLQHYLKMDSGQIEQHLAQANMGASEYYLKHFKGACFRSGASTKFTIGSVDHLTPQEYDILKVFGFDEAFQ